MSNDTHARWQNTESRYGLEKYCQWHHSIERQSINTTLIDEGEKYDNIKLNFFHKLVSIDFHRKLLTVSNGDRICEESFALAVHSVVRTQMQFNVKPETIEHEYKELIIQNNNNFAMKLSAHLASR